tara:strand:- start:480 stop:635 length:156 start_codon:yes stop_codon:yes gene_type:complete
MAPEQCAFIGKACISIYKPPQIRQLKLIAVEEKSETNYSLIPEGGNIISCY